MQNKKINENKILVIGAVLIALVFLIMTLKPETTKNNEENKTELESYKEIPTISAQETIKKIVTNENIKLFDTRTQQEFQTAHIIDSNNVPLEIISDNQNIFSENKINVFIIDEKQSKQFTELFNEIQKKISSEIELYVLRGGLNEWKKAGGQIISIPNPSSFEDNAKISKITTDELRKKIADKSPLHIIDSRASTYYANGHIPGAQNIPIEELENKRKSISSGSEIVIYGYDAMESFTAGVYLFDLGYLSTLTLSDGYSGWLARGFEVEK